MGMLRRLIRNNTSSPHKRKAAAFNYMIASHIDRKSGVAKKERRQVAGYLKKLRKKGYHAEARSMYKNRLNPLSSV